MAKITICGSAMVVTSSKTLEEIKLLEKYSPKSLELMDEDGKVAFKVCTSEIGSVSQFGVAFASETRDDSHLACITIAIPEDVVDAKAYASDTIGSAIVKLNKVEEGFALALRVVEAEQQEILSNIVMA